MSLNLASLILHCAPLVHPVTMQALVAVESASQPYAISINYPERLERSGYSVPVLDRSPSSSHEALMQIHEWTGQGYTVSVGLAQINAERLSWLRSQHIADSIESLLDPCTNLRASQAILIDCWKLIAGFNQTGTERLRLHQTLSCYNSGHPTWGIRNGYAQRVMAAARRLTLTRAGWLTRPRV